MRTCSWIALTSFALLGGPAVAALKAPSTPDPAGVELFEKAIRPLLVGCQACHGQTRTSGGLRLTSRALLLAGGGRGPAVAPGRPEESLLLRALEYRGDLKMPPSGRLNDGEIAQVRRWIALGAPWPEPPGPAPGAAGEFRPTEAQRRWWAFQPVRDPKPPALPGPPLSPIDRFIRAGLNRRGLAPSPPANRRTLIRRVTFDLTGLPPTPEEVEAFLRECAQEDEARRHRSAASGRVGERASGRTTWQSRDARAKTSGRVGARGSGRRSPLSRENSPIPPVPRSPTPGRETAPSSTAYERLVDRLLASPAYGERYARHWLDLVRYADYDDGDPKARVASCEPLQAWRYRDWVVSAFNRDLPFDQFITYQIAGDLIVKHHPPFGREPGRRMKDEGETKGAPRASSERNGIDSSFIPHPSAFDPLVATTFLSNGSWDRGDADKEKMVSDMVDDQIDTVGKAFLGLTLGCARCHNHKFDPIAQKDYYALAGIFYSTHILKDIGTKGGEYTLNRIPLAPADTVARREKQLAELAAASRALADLDKKTPKPAPDDPERKALLARRDSLQSQLLPEPALAEAAQEGGTAGGLFPGIQDVPVHVRGSYTRLGEVVPRRMPVFLAGAGQPPITQGSGRRELAAWIASRRNPLTARVIVNRVWQWHFGTGLVRTPNNLGMLSEPPSHPELLDWLASRFAGVDGSKLMVDGKAPSNHQPSTINHQPGLGWSLKKLHRLILLSSVYQQSSDAGAPAGDRATRISPLRSKKLETRNTKHETRNGLAVDPENRWLGRFSPRRLEAEEIRDSMLAAAGRLYATRGGPASADLNTPRRSLYVQTARWDRGTMAMLFDAANPDASEEKRNLSIVAPQALFLLNQEFTLAQARLLAERLAREVTADEAARLQRAYLLLYARPATTEELRLGRDFLRQNGGRGSESAWQDLCHVLLCSNELIFVD